MKITKNTISGMMLALSGLNRWLNWKKGGKYMNEWKLLTSNEVEFGALIAKEKDCFMLFDNGDVARCSDDNLPMAIATHFKPIRNADALLQRSLDALIKSCSYCENEAPCDDCGVCKHVVVINDIKEYLKGGNTMTQEQYKEIAASEKIEAALRPELISLGLHIKRDCNGDNFGIMLFKEPQDEKYHNTSATFQVFEVTSLNMDGSISEIEKYCSAYIKWDSCSHFHFRDEGYLHLCGAGSYKMHFWIMEQIYKQAFIAMNREPEIGEEW